MTGEKPPLSVEAFFVTVNSNRGFLSQQLLAV